MPLISNLVAKITRMLNTVKTMNLDWRLENQDKLAALKQAQALAEKDLEIELKKRSARLEHDLAQLKIQHDAELSVLKIKYSQDVQDYKNYLLALEQLKRSIEASYSHLPQAMIFAIHHHAKFLLNTMWETQDFAERIRHEVRLLNFMSTVHEDARLFLEGDSAKNLPLKTLGLIEDSGKTDTI
ncbi:MAG: hypothetical protein CTY34_00090 [Methylobacter sp.]|nr:MAG: hypothetical protein CTY34_00090 [Methylobacter sp.]PPD05037.1 MAG: hypothetical protein CTY29_03295 [Methylobacter sp.]PPD21109.1 MAG: hypothetical protein CTY24_08380 [Methylobacter sp.]PPD32032.1 MAG: hypothetical protein CTY18_11830 [Methylomonas sp.]